MLIDTHCHLDFKDFAADRDQVVDRAKKAGVIKIINVGSSLEGTRRAVELAKKYDMVYATLGIHPHDAKSVTEDTITEFRSLAKEPKVLAIGEVGLDYYRNLSPKDVQIEAFRKFIRLAQELELPLILHGREANDDMLKILKEEIKGPVRGVMHCFSGDELYLKACLDMGLYVSFTANLTFKNAQDLRETARKAPIERLLLETDAPYLAPQAFRGKRNESSYLTYLVDELAGLVGFSNADVERITTHNANRLFKLDIEESTKIAYPIRDSLYLNITNRCTNACYFCIRNSTEFVKGHNLRLTEEPSVEDVLKAIGDPTRYKEIVFCGYGEPTLRLDLVKDVSKKVKETGGHVRLVTNGHGDMINKRPIAKELAGLVDRVSISLNADNVEKYIKVCIPKFGSVSYEAVLGFIRDCVNNNIETEVTCLDLPEVDVKKCEEMSRSFGARFRLRSYGVVG